MDVSDAFIALGISLGLGLLVGLQRERSKSMLAGIRTFPLIAALGTLCALAAEHFGGWITFAGLLGVIATIVSGNLIALRRDGGRDPGVTTEVAMLLMFAIGAYLVHGHRAVAVAMAGAMTVLLYAKPIMHGWVDRLGEGDVRAIMQFVLIAMIILPILPNEPYGPFDVLNPRTIWLMVVLVVGLSLGAYLISRFVGEHAGVILTGILGGIISSTATTVSSARRAAAEPASTRSMAVIIMIASTVVYGRVLVEIAIVAPRAFWLIAPPVIAMLGLTAALAGILWFTSRKSMAAVPESGNPAELRAALIFGGMYAVVILAVAAVQHYLSDDWIIAVAAISGLTDLDAITLSTSGMVQNNRLAPTAAWKAILVASMSNLVFKAGIVAVLGGRRLLIPILAHFGILIAAGVAVLIFWPQ